MGGNYVPAAVVVVGFAVVVDGITGSYCIDSMQCWSSCIDIGIKFVSNLKGGVDCSGDGVPGTGAFWRSDSTD